MDDLQIKVFQAVARSGSFAGGAEELYLSRSSVKRQIDTLENELKVQLFDRTSQGVVLTEAGKKFQEGIGPITDTYDELVRQVRHTGDHRVIRIAYSPSIPITRLSGAIKTYSHQHDNVSIELKSMPYKQHIAAVRDGEADICVFYFTDEAKAADLDLWRIPSFEKVSCYVSAKDPLAKHEKVEVDDLKGRRVTCRHSFMPGVVRTLAGHGIKCKNAHLDEQDLAEIMSFIQEGGVHIMTGECSDLLGCAEVPLDVDDIGCTGGLLTKRDPPDYIVEFIELFDDIKHESRPSAAAGKAKSTAPSPDSAVATTPAATAAAAASPAAAAKSKTVPKTKARSKEGDPSPSPAAR